MADKSGNRAVTDMFGTDVNELKLGRSFYKNKEGAFHTVRYDFKPASIDHSKPATLEVKDGSGVNISFPNDENKGGPASTNFKGPMKPCQKDCVLIFDHRSGEFTLERLTSNINVKIQRLEGSSKAKLPPPKPPSTAKPNTAQLKNKVKSSAGKRSSSSSKPAEPKPVELPKPVEPPRSITPPSVSPPRPQRPPTPDAMSDHQLSEEELSPEHQEQPAAPVTQRLSQDSSEEEKLSASENSSSEEENSSSESSSEEEEEETSPQAAHPKRARLSHQESSPPSPAQTKVRRDSGQILNQLQHDLSLSESESDGSD